MIITFLMGLIVVLSEFIPHRPFSGISSSLEEWFMIVSGFAIVLGLISLIRVNTSKVLSKAENWQYYFVGLCSLFLMVTVGLLWGMQNRNGILGDGGKIVNWLGAKPFDYLFDHVYLHLSATMFALLAFFIASAAYRAFIIRSFESNLLMLAAVIVIIGRTSFGSLFTAWIPDSMSILRIPEMTDFIMQYPNSAAQRAIMISAALGIIGSSLRIIIGIERSYLGSD
jgi:hypothetical protein